LSTAAKRGLDCQRYTVFRATPASSAAAVMVLPEINARRYASCAGERSEYSRSSGASLESASEISPVEAGGLGGAEIATAAAFIIGASAVVTAWGITLLPLGEKGTEEFGETRVTEARGPCPNVRFLLTMLGV